MITAVDGTAIDRALDLSRTIAGKNPDTTVELTIWRNGAEQTITVKLGKLDETASASHRRSSSRPAEAGRSGSDSQRRL